MKQKRSTGLRSLALLILCASLWVLGMPAKADGSGTLSVLGRSYTLAAGQSWDGDLAIVGGTAHLLEGSTLNGSISAVGGAVTIDGTVNGEVVGMGATIDLGQHAVVKGDLVVLGTLRRHPDARVLGDIIQGSDASRHLQALPGILGSGINQFGTTPTRPMPPLTSAARSVEHWLGWMLALLVTAALAELLLPQNIERTSAALVGSWIESLATGLLTLIASALVIPLLVILCLGIPVAIVLVIALVLAVLLGWVAAGKLVGSRLLLALRIKATTPMIDTLVGVMVLSIIAAIPCLGTLFGLGISAWGIGAVTLTRFGARAYPPLPSTTEAQSEDDRPPHDTHPLDATKAPPESEA